ncbi:hypothetical protein JYU34_015075 [Plutella xylostella]|uniref:Regulatory protein zeste n=1 Tax=Plutella xylostella TaxID=51655 RepID=A0ABQ7Q6A4_PLUXY|nr:hypothetical protein JYU34_015075 [Plutella xylostella]
MNEVNTSSSRVSYSQLQALHVFMEEHRELDAGFLRSTEARHKSQKLWQELAVTLNCIGGGSNKTVKKSFPYRFGADHRPRKNLQIAKKLDQALQGMAKQIYKKKLDQAP